MKRNKYGKPIIRHCENCKWSTHYMLLKCTVRYKFIDFPKIKTKFCRFFEEKE